MQVLVKADEGERHNQFITCIYINFKGL